MSILVTPGDLKLSELQILVEAAITKCLPIPQLTATTESVKSKLSMFKLSMSRQSAKSNKKVFDDNRDHLGRACFTQVDIDAKFPGFSEEIKAEIEKAKQITEKYGRKLFNLPFDQETVQYDYCLADFDKLNHELLAETGIIRWLPYMHEANEQFKYASEAYIQDEIKEDSVVSAYAQAKVLKTELDELFIQLFSYARTVKSTELINAEIYLSKFIEEL